jgi:hypothetical protein
MSKDDVYGDLGESMKKNVWVSQMEDKRDVLLEVCRRALNERKGQHTCTFAVTEGDNTFVLIDDPLELPNDRFIYVGVIIGMRMEKR